MSGEPPRYEQASLTPARLARPIPRRLTPDGPARLTGLPRAAEPPYALPVRRPRPFVSRPAPPCFQPKKSAFRRTFFMVSFRLRGGGGGIRAGRAARASAQSKADAPGPVSRPAGASAAARRVISSKSA